MLPPNSLRAIPILVEKRPQRLVDVGVATTK
jgi:hypothetical protein